MPRLEEAGHLVGLNAEEARYGASHVPPLPGIVRTVLLFAPPSSACGSAGTSPNANVAITTNPGLQQMPSIAVDPLDPGHPVTSYLNYAPTQTKTPPSLGRKLRRPGIAKPKA